MNFKSRSAHTGMTFIEVVLAIFIIGSLLSSLLLLQSNIVRAVWQFSSRANRILLLKNRLMQALLEQEKKEKESPKEKKVEEPKTTITYEQKKISKDSALKKFENIVIEKVSAQWQEWDTKQKETMITFLYKPEKKEA